MTAILHEGTPGAVLGPRPRPGPAPAARRRPRHRRRRRREPLDLDRPHPGARAARSTRRTYDVTPDGSTVVATWRVDEPRGASRHALVALDVAAGTGERRVLLDDPDHDRRRAGRRLPGRPAGSPACAPAGPPPPSRPDHALRRGAGRRQRRAARDVAPGWDRWSPAFAWTPDGAALVVTADDGGRAPLFRVDLATGGTVTRLTDDHGAYTDLRSSARTARRLRAALGRRRPARAGPARPAGARPAPVPAARPRRPPLPGTPHRGDRHRRGRHAAARLAGAARRRRRPTPPPRCCCGSTAARWIAGTPGPGAGTRGSGRPRATRCCCPTRPCPPGTGSDFVARGWGRWGDEPYTDLHGRSPTPPIARTTSTPTRTAAMGGSFGGYMANWVAGHTDRFRRDRHARQPVGARPVRRHHRRRHYWRREMTPRDGQAEHSPHRYADAIATPMLVIHGDRTTGCRSARRCGCGPTWLRPLRRPVPHKFLYFPDENHWVLRAGTRPALVRDGARLPRLTTCAGPTGWSRICCAETGCAAS